MITAQLMSTFSTVRAGEDRPAGALEDVSGDSLSAVTPTDDEILAGLMGFTRQLSRFCTLRATLGDGETVERAAKVVSDINAKLLNFDFRNGSLRKKYDGVKYVVRECEKILYDLSLSRARRGRGDDGTRAEMPPAKRQKISHTNSDSNGGDGGVSGAVGAVGAAAAAAAAAAAGGEVADGVDAHPTLALLDEICARYKAYDERRERVIKASRDIQKLAKTAVFAVHRGKREDARKKIEKGMRMALQVGRLGILPPP